jgi:hypothetical protein
MVTAIKFHEDGGRVHVLVDTLQTVLEEGVVFKTSLEATAWIGDLLWDAWSEVLHIHLEHSGVKSISGCGPPFGFSIHNLNIRQVVSNPPQNPSAAAVPTAASAAPPAAPAAPWAPPEGSWSECDLYD